MVQDPEEACDDGNADQASDELETENNAVARARVVSVQHSDFGNVEQTSERASVLPALVRLQHIRLVDDSEIVLFLKSHPQQEQRGGGPAHPGSVAEPHTPCDDNPCPPPEPILKRRRALQVRSDEEPD